MAASAEAAMPAAAIRTGRNFAAIASYAVEPFTLAAMLSRFIVPDLPPPDLDLPLARLDSTLFTSAAAPDVPVDAGVPASVAVGSAFFSSFGLYRYFCHATRPCAGIVYLRHLSPEFQRGGHGIGLE